MSAPRVGSLRFETEVKKHTEWDESEMIQIWIIKKFKALPSYISWNHWAQICA